MGPIEGDLCHGLDMWTVRKLLGRDDERRSRLHTRRGNLLPLSELVRAPRLMLQRIGRTEHEPEPWMARGALLALDQLLTRDTSLLELGSGNSTVWYARRTKATTSLEDNGEWAERVADMCRGMANVTLVRVESLKAGVEALGDVQFDVAVIDHNDAAGFTRVDAAAALRARSSVIVLDDSDRSAYREVDALLSGWRVERFVSLRASPFQATETTVYRAP
jgi:predicted O-methyltransferase YrrM